ncbi:hypothetical protein RDWZM_006261 [Blomia tropicalis]|uniref:NEDD8-activating enzyme E1 regulatory subunit n=1 Tax=Blomia tropicalis TaxID=40697 RepID=A0A9Q0RN53_BLOTA|nr:hypothetical protein RDWZM_006261 [Blomia tropicalis]
MATTPSPKSPENDKSKRYDRQLRLWGERGQMALESSHVCLIHANSVGTEILKSLVLPGIRAFTIIDENKVTEDDFDSNFFLCIDGSLGQSRAKIASQLLMEMNNDVKKGDYVEENFETLLDQNEKYFTSFTLVIACGIDNERSLNKLSQALWTLNVPLLLVKSIGFLGYIRLQIREQQILEPHPDNYLEDLRLDMLFPELKEFLDEFPDFKTLTRHELSRIPALVVIYKNLIKWQTKFGKNSNDIPKNYREKSQLSSLIKEEIEFLKEKITNSQNVIHTNEENGDALALGTIELENFEEAIKMINKVFINSNRISENLQTLLNEATEPVRQCSSSFWVMLAALKIFIEKYHCLPLKGSIPDMNCGSELYVKLQKIYKNKAQQDVDKMLKIIQKLPKTPNVVVSEKEVQLLCRNAPYLTVIRTNPIYNELTGDRLKKFSSRLQNGTDEEGSEFDELRFYLLMRIADRFYSKQNRLPGQHDDEIENDVSEMKREFRELCTDLGFNIFIKDELVHEICRYGGCELHSISAFIGGCAAHEAIKLITGQYVPINNTFVYNGLNCTTMTYKL